MAPRGKIPGISLTIDTVELSDAFRRRAVRQDKEIVAAIVKEARNFVGISSWHDPYEKFRFDSLKESLTASARNLASLAEQLGAERIILPINGDPKSPFAQFYGKHVLIDTK